MNTYTNIMIFHTVLTWLFWDELRSNDADFKCFIEFESSLIDIANLSASEVVYDKSELIMSY